MRTLTNATIDWSGKNVFCRVDFNVPLTESGDVADDERIVRRFQPSNILWSKVHESS